MTLRTRFWDRRTISPKAAASPAQADATIADSAARLNW